MPGELVLSRKEQQRIIIELDGRLVELAVHDIRSDKVRLRFNAPPDVVIDREEVWLRRQAEAAAANDETKPFLRRLEEAHARGVDLLGGQTTEEALADADAELKLAILRDRQRELATARRIAHLEQTLKLVLAQWDTVNGQTPADQRVYRHAANVLSEDMER